VPAAVPSPSAGQSAGPDATGGPSALLPPGSAGSDASTDTNGGVAGLETPGGGSAAGAGGGTTASSGTSQAEIAAAAEPTSNDLHSSLVFPALLPGVPNLLLGLLFAAEIAGCVAIWAYVRRRLRA
jgi:hypothetical protein